MVLESNCKLERCRNGGYVKDNKKRIIKDLAIFAADWEEAKVGFLMISVAISCEVAFYGGKQLKEDVSYGKVLKKVLNGEGRAYEQYVLFFARFIFVCDI